MSAPGQEMPSQAQQEPPEPTLGGMRIADPLKVVNAHLDAAMVLAGKAAAGTSAQEAKDFATAAKMLLEGVALLDPTLDKDGVPADRQIAVEQVKLEGQMELERLRITGQLALEELRGKHQMEAAQAQARARSMTVKRDGEGRMTGIEEG